MTILHILLKTTFEMPSFLIKKNCERGILWTDSWFLLLQIWCTYFLDDQQLTRSKKLYDVVTFLVSFFNLLFSKYVLKIPVVIFFQLALLLYTFKANIKLVCCFWKLLCIAHVITVYTIKALQLFWALTQATSRALF